MDSPMEELRRNAEVMAAIKLGALMSFRNAAQWYPEFERRVDELVAARSLGLG